MIRSATVDLDTIKTNLVVVDKGMTRHSKPRNENPLEIPPERISPRDIDRALSPGTNIHQGNAKPPDYVEKAEQAKWQRLIEVLGLSNDQAKTLEATITESEPTPAEGQALDTAYAETGKKLQAKINATLNEEQTKAFKELQERSLKNQLVSKAMQQYRQELGNFDLSEAQMKQALEVLVDHEKAESVSIPNSTRLLLDGSVLPIGGRRISDDSFTLLRKLGSPDSGAPVGIEEVAAIQRTEMERRMTQYKGILTTAQLERYQAGIKESSENLDIISPPN